MGGHSGIERTVYVGEVDDGAAGRDGEAVARRHGNVRHEVANRTCDGLALIAIGRVAQEPSACERRPDGRAGYPPSPASTPRMKAKDRCMPGNGSDASISYSRLTKP